MSSDRKPIAKLTYSKDGKYFGILSIWKSDRQAGSYSISREKPHGNREVMTLGEALRAWTAGDGFLDFSIESEREYPGQTQRRDDQPVGGGSGGGEFGDDDIPFRQASKGVAQ